MVEVENHYFFFSMDIQGPSSSIALQKLDRFSEWVYIILIERKDFLHYSRMKLWYDVVSNRTFSCIINPSHFFGFSSVIEIIIACYQAITMHLNALLFFLHRYSLL